MSNEDVFAQIPPNVRAWADVWRQWGRTWWALAPYILFLTAVPVIAHLLFSRLGFNPTDDGFTLAYSRRLLDGQIPHRDFISIRPVGSPLLHVPFVLWGGRHIFLLSRLFVWFQFAWIALAWTQATSRACGVPADRWRDVCVASIAFALSAHYFPIMAWHTIDGLYFVASGLVLCGRENPRWRLAGYLLIAVAYLCKQNFVFLAPAAVLVGGDWRRPAAWSIIALPGVAYLAFLAATGAAGDAWIQLGSQTDIFAAGFWPYLWENGTAWGALFGFVAVMLLGRRGGDAMLGVLGISAAILAASHAMAVGRFIGAPAFGLFGMAGGATLYLTMNTGRRDAGIAGVMTVLASWCVGLSIGYDTPALAGGLAAAYLLNLALAAPVVRPLAALPVLAGIAAVVLLDFRTAREQHVYLDRAAAELTFPLDDVLPGAAGLRTNQNTYDYLVDLRAAVALAPDRAYAVLPDCAGYWVAAAEANPLSIDWPQWIELARPALLARVTSELAAQKGHLTVIVAKVRAAPLARGFFPLPDGERYAVATFVRQHFTVIAQTRFFTLYR